MADEQFSLDDLQNAIDQVSKVLEGIYDILGGFAFYQSKEDPHMRRMHAVCGECEKIVDIPLPMKASDLFHSLMDHDSDHRIQDQLGITSN